MRQQSENLIENGSMPVFNLVGVNHRVLALDQREVFAGIESDPLELLRSVSRSCADAEVAVLSTCNRFEIISIGSDAEGHILDFLSSRLRRAVPLDRLYRLRGQETLRHVFRVAASMDSAVLGEPQIISQVKEAYRRSIACGCAGKYLHQLFQFAFRLSKKIRTNTGIAERGISLSYIAVKLAEQLFESLANCRVLVIGAGEMAELLAVHLRTYGCRDITIANRTIEHAVSLAERVDGAAVSFAEAERCAACADVVISSTAAAEPILKTSFFSSLKRQMPLFVIDFGVPRNIAAGVGDLENIYLYDIDDLGRIAQQNQGLRLEAAKDAEVMVEYGVREFEKLLHRIALQPEIVDFRGRVQKICTVELQRSLADVLDEDELGRILPELSRRIGSKVMHDATTAFKHCGCRDIEDPLILPCFFDERLKVIC